MTRLSLFVTLLSALSAPALAADDPQLAALLAQGPAALLAEADARHNRRDDETLTVRMTTHGKGDEGRTLKVVIRTKGDRRALRFEEPGDIRGMGIVVKGKDEIYVRLPDAPKVRRVASHARRQTLQGTDYSLDDGSLIVLGKDYTPTLTGQTDGHVELTLERRPESAIGYDRLVIHVDKATLLIDYLKYFIDGKAMKEQTRSKPKFEGPFPYFTHMEIKSLEKDHATHIDVLKAEINTQMSPRTFSKRWLMRGR
jgi:hypothetical protein